MSSDRHGRDPGPVPPEFEHLLRPEGSPGSIGSGQTPRHDRVSETALSDFADLFRDPPPAATEPEPAATPYPPAPPEDSGATQILPTSAPAGAAATSRMPPVAGRAHAVQVEPSPVRTAPPPATGPARSKWSGRTKRIIAIVLVALLAYVVTLVAYFALTVGKVKALPADQIADTAGSNYLLVGSDGREKLTKKQQRVLHTGDTEGQRTDTIMLLHVPNIGTPTLISIPRDSWVPIPGHGNNKINAAFAEGGAPLLVQTVENTTGVHIDHYVEIGMLGIADVTDALGGVTLCPQRDFDDEKSGLKVKKGCQTMAGRDALAYVRMRYSDPKGDAGRTERQQEFIKATVSRTANPLTFLNPIRMFSADNAAASSLTLDEGTGVVADGRMALAMGMLSMGWGESTSVPIETDEYWVGGQQAVKWNTPKALELFKSVGGG